MAAELASIAAFEESRARDALERGQVGERRGHPAARPRRRRALTRPAWVAKGRLRLWRGSRLSPSQVASELEEAKALVAQCEAELTVRADELKRAEGAELEALAVAEEVGRARRALDERARALAESRAELSIRGAGLEERKALLARRRDEVERRLAGLEEARSQAETRRVSLEAAGLALGRLSDELVRLAGELTVARDGLQARASQPRARRRRDYRAPAAACARSARGPSTP